MCARKQFVIMSVIINGSNTFRRTLKLIGVQFEGYNRRLSHSEILEICSNVNTSSNGMLHYFVSIYTITYCMIFDHQISTHKITLYMYVIDI